MKTTTALALASTLGFALSGLTLAADANDPAPIVHNEQTTIRATIVAIDKAQRTVTLKGPEGNTMDLIVDDGVTRFDALKVGDVVMAGYSESAKFEIQAKGTPIAPDSVARAGGKIAGEKPGGSAADTSVRTVIITTIDSEAPSVTIKNADGGSETFRVRHPEYLQKFKVGQQVRVTRTKSLLVKVEAAPAQ